jgi:predicted P-loop ATPase
MSIHNLNDAPPSPQPNKADINSHLYALFPPDFVRQFPDALIEIAYGPPGNVNGARLFSVFKLDEATDFAIAQNLKGRNVYVGPTLKRPATAPFARTTDEDFLASIWAWIDNDAAGEVERALHLAKELTVEPGMLVGTGATPHVRAHGYFRLAKPITDGELLRTINDALHQRFGGDAVQNPGRIMRLAGTVNYPTARKRDERGYVTEVVTLKVAKSPPMHSVERLTGLRPSGAAADDKASDYEPRSDSSGFERGGSNFFRDVNSLALRNLDRWVPVLFPTAKLQSGTGAWRVTSHDLGRDLEEDLSISPKGIRDWGVHDIGDPKRGKRTPIDLVKELGGQHTVDAARWLCERIGVTPEELGWRKRASHAAGAPEWREQRTDGSPRPSMHNARLAIAALGVECRYDTFHNKLLFGFKDDSTRHAIEHIAGEVTDNGIIALRQLMSDAFGFDLTDKHTRDAVISLAIERCFDPVCDMLAEAEASWDRVPRLDRMAVDYFNCEDTPLNRAFLRKTMIAAVARARVPGIKFDQITVLESDEGFSKSTAWRVLAGDENFSDENIIGKNSREVQEQLSEIWIHENADLAGMKKAEIETVKAYASRMIDIARPAYGHFIKKQKRHSIEVGTTNSAEYLQSQTGNRRFWPLKVLKAIDEKKLQRDRLQLWGEAAHYQSQGESLFLDQAMWAVAAVEQEARRIADPWEDVLADMPTSVEVNLGVKDGFMRTEMVQIAHNLGDEVRVAAATILEHVLKIQPGSQRAEHTMRLSSVMRKLGWQRHGNGRVTIGGDRVKGYFRPANDTEGQC